jgi:hypothetical protein
MSVRVLGLDQAIREIKKQVEQAIQITKDVLEDTATGIEVKAIQRAPSQVVGIQLNIKQRIDKVRQNNGLNWIVGVQGTQDIDAYVEFGTGLDFLQIVNSDPRYTPEIKAIAKIFFKTGKGTLKGTPYLFPSYFEETANLVQELKNEIARGLK